jgi:rfaE bifunctional protein kinase chain/domain
VTHPSAERLRQIASSLGGRSILVVGDSCLDEYLVGEPQRLSREAPVPVLEFAQQWTLPGSAANPTRNVIALGSSASLVTVVGDDASGETLLQQLRESKIDVSGAVVVKGQPTTRKTRILARGSQRFPQQVVRIDRTRPPGLTPDVTAQLVASIERLAPSHDAVLVSDYRNGIIDQAVIDCVRDVANRHGKLATVDSQGDLLRFAGFAVVKSNRDEAEATLHARLEDDRDFAAHGRALLDRLEARSVVITRGPAGMSVVDNQDVTAHIPATNQSEVFDVTGAGDTVIAVMTLALVAGATTVEAATLANYAAGIVVRRLGNATTSVPELTAAIN